MKLLGIFIILPLYIDETPAITIATLSNRARRIKRLFGLNLIVVDYIQLMRSSSNKNEGRVQEISEITQGLKALSKRIICSCFSIISTIKSSGTERR